MSFSVMLLSTAFFMEDNSSSKKKHPSLKRSGCFTELRSSNVVQCLSPKLSPRNTVNIAS